MTGTDAHLLDLFEDLEQQAEGLHRVERDALVEDLARAEYGEVDVLARLHASIGRRVLLTRTDGEQLRGDLARVGRDFCLVLAGRCQWVQPVAALARLSELSSRAVAEPARGLQARLSMRGVLRRLSEEGSTVEVHLCSGRSSGLVGRVGRDFFEFRAGQRGDDDLVLLAAVRAIRVAG